MKLWAFMEFATLGQRRVITQWVAKDLAMEAEIELHDTLRFLSVTPRQLWTRPEYSPFDAEISEIRFKANGLQHRVFGFFLSDEKQYVMLIGAQKKMKIYDPRDAIETARKRRKLVLTDRSCIHEYTDYQF